MKNQLSILSLFISISLWSSAQSIESSVIKLNGPVIINFSSLPDYEGEISPERRCIEQETDDDDIVIYKHNQLPADVHNFNVPLARYADRTMTSSPAPAVSFNGVVDNGTVIPPDIEGAAGHLYIMETTNQQFNIYTKAGALKKAVAASNFFTGSGSANLFDPRIAYDPVFKRFLICMDGKLSNGDMGITVAISETDDPTGNWYIYTFDGAGNSADLLDFPILGFNSNWVVISTNDFIGGQGGSSITAKIFVLSRASLYSGSLGTLKVFTDNSSYCLAPARTYDSTQTTEYLVQNYDGNNGGKGYVQLATITGSVSSPVYTLGSTLGINQPWSDNTVGAPQLGGSTPLDAGPTRMGAGTIYSNGSLWFSHTVFLPASGPTHAACDWWQVNPAAPAVQQFGRVEDPAGSIFYFYPSINVNAKGDALLTYCISSAGMYAAAAYSFHAAADPAGTMQSDYIYKSGIANYVVIGHNNLNRWGDFTGVALDPSDNSFWAFSEWANKYNSSYDYWGTAVANIKASGATSIAEPQSENAFTIYPNPAFNQLNIFLTPGPLWKTVNISIMNVLGEEIQSIQLPTPNSQLPTLVDVSSLPAGMYFLEMKTGSGIATQRFVKE